MTQASAEPKNASLTVNVLDFDVPPSSGSPSTPFPRTAKVVGRLDSKWRELERKWNADNGEQLGRLDINGKQGVLARWKKRYDSDAGDKSSEDMLNILDKVLNGVELVGAFAAQGVSMVFSPAGMCFNAIGFLIDFPRQIKKVYDALQDLFEEVNQFLIRFRIYKRLDDKGRLPDELVDNTSDLLITFVKICGKAARLLRGGFRAKLELGVKVLLRDDEMKGHLDAFRNLVNHSTMLSGTVMLEEVMNNSEATKQILSFAGEMRSDVRLLVARSNIEKTKQVNKDRLDRIGRKLFDRPPGEEMLVALKQEDTLPKTLETLQATEEYKQWSEDSSSARSVLILWGPAGCGKSRMLEEFRAHLEVQRDDADKGEPNTYTAFFDFNDTRPKAVQDQRGKGPTSSISHALRSIAYQVANQSTTYATDLFVQLSKGSDSKAANIRQEKDVEALWSSLGLAQLSTTETSTLYILLDGIERESPTEEQKLMRALLKTPDRIAPELLRIKILLTRKLKPEPDTSVSSALSLNQVNQDLVVAFAFEEMKRLDILQHRHKETRTLRRDVLKRLSTHPEHFTFEIVKARLAMLKKAIDDEAPKGTMDTILNTKVSYDSAGEGRALLEELEREFAQKTKSVVLLNKLLIWLVLSHTEYWGIEELEAALHLENAELPIEPLGVKISRSYHKAIDTGERFVSLNPVLRDVLHENSLPIDGKDAPALEERSISLNITINNADESTIKQFVWDLNEHMSTGRFDFSKTSGQNAIAKIGVSAVEGNLTITRLCFKLMNEGWDKQTEPLLWYACAYLPRHLAYLQKMALKIRASDKHMIGEGLVTLLRENYVFEQNHEHHGTDPSWMENDDEIGAIRFWLAEPETKGQLPLKERRWIDGALQESRGRLGFLLDLAIAIGRQWLTDARSLSDMLYVWLDRFIEQNTKSPPETNAVESVVGRSDDFQSFEVDLQKITLAPDAEEATEAAPAANDNDIQIATDSQGPTEQPESVGEPDTVLPGEVIKSSNASSEDSSSTKPTETIDEVMPGPKLTSIDRVERALNWVLSHTKISQTDGAYFAGLGRTYVLVGEYNKAIDYYTRVSEDSDVLHEAFRGLADCYVALSDQDKAYEYCQKCFKLYSDRADRGVLHTTETTQYIYALEHFGRVFQNWNSPERALEFLTEAHSRRPEAHEMAWTLIKLHCEVSATQEEALRLLENWHSEMGEFAGASPANSLLQMAEESEHSPSLLPMVRAMKNPKLQERCSALIEEALTVGENNESTASFRLQYLQGVIYALHADNDLRSKATTYWGKVLRVAAPSEAGEDWILSETVNMATTNLLKSAFDGIKARLPATSAPSEDERKALQRELQETFDHIIRDCAVRVARGVNTFEKYVISLDSILGFSEDARNRCMDDMGFALEILSDEDPDNDKDGLDTLARVLCACGDRIGTLSAMSLLDRAITKKRFLSDGLNTTESADSLDFRDKVDSGWLHWCDGCGKDIFSSDREGMWWCPFCPNFDLCTECKGKHAGGTLRLELCNPEHVSSFIHLFHSGYTEEELQDGKVKIDWEYVEDGQGGFKRQGGRVVEVSEWVEELRLKWNLPKPQGDGSRAQK